MCLPQRVNGGQTGWTVDGGDSCVSRTFGGRLAVRSLDAGAPSTAAAISRQETNTRDRRRSIMPSDEMGA